MRKTIWIVPVLLLITAIGAPTILSASDITYTVSEAVGPGSVTGFITTDGIIGTLATADILDWSLILNDGTNPTFTLEGPLSGNNSHVADFGSDLTASATQLLYNFSGTDDGPLQFQSPDIGSGGPFLCYTDIPNAANPNQYCALNEPVGIQLNVLTSFIDPPPSLVNVEKSGNEAIAAVVSTPEPGTFSLMVLGVVGLMVLERKRIAQGLPQIT